MRPLKEPVGIASLLTELGRQPGVIWAKVRRDEEWRLVSVDRDRPAAAGDPVERHTQANLRLCTDFSSGEVTVAELALEDSPDTRGGAVVTAVDLRVVEEYRLIAIVVAAIGRGLQPEEEAP